MRHGDAELGVGHFEIAVKYSTNLTNVQLRHLLADLFVMGVGNELRNLVKANIYPTIIRGFNIELCAENINEQHLRLLYSLAYPGKMLHQLYLSTKLYLSHLRTLTKKINSLLAVWWHYTSLERYGNPIKTVLWLKSNKLNWFYFLFSIFKLKYYRYIFDKL